MVMWFNVPEARAELLKEKHVFTLRPKRRKREGHEILMYDGFGKKGDLEVEYWGKFSEMDYYIVREIAKNSGFNSLEDWLKAAKEADFLYYVRLVPAKDTTEVQNNDEERTRPLPEVL